MLRRPHRLFLITAACAAACLGPTACGVDNSFDPVPTGGRTEIYGDLTVVNQLEADNLRGIRRIIGNLHVKGAGVKHLAGLRDLETVTGRLKLSNCDLMEDVGGLEGLRTVGELQLVSCDLLRDLAPLAGLRDLDSLSIAWCDSFRTLPTYPFINDLQSFELDRNDKLESLDALREMHGLRSLRLENLHENLDYEVVSEFESLTELGLYSLPLQTLPDLSGNPYLYELELVYLHQIENLAELHLPNLRRLEIRDCRGLTSLAGLGPCPALEFVEINTCTDLVSLETSGGLGNAAVLDIWNCDNLVDLAGLTADWSRVEIAACDGLTSLAGAAVDSTFGELTLDWLRNLTSLDGLPEGLELRELEILDCPNLASVAGPVIAPGGSLRLRSLDSLTSLDGLRFSGDVYHLDLQGVDFPDLRACSTIESAWHVEIGYSDLTNLDGMENLATIGWQLGLYYNQQLNDVSALSGVDSVGAGGVMIYGHPLLDNCVVEEMIADWSVAGDAVLGFNGPCAE